MSFKNKNAIMAPNGSDKADIKVYKIALDLLLVLEYIGIDILIPSGILCNAIAILRESPILIFVELVINVAIHSGILCKIMANILIIPTLYSLLLLALFSGKYLSIVIDKIIPIQIHINITIILGKLNK